MPGANDFVPRTPFPFLIGRIRTIFGVPPEIMGIMFPFLIGRIRTFDDKMNVTSKKTEFPFLIGRIRTFEVKVFIRIFKSFHSS